VNCRALFEQDSRSASFVVETRKSFDALAKGLLSKNSRGDWTPLELFVADLRGWDRPELERTATIGRQQLDGEMTGLQRIRELAKRKPRKSTKR
jgi:hypothetical protein